jgi:transcriptional regulator with XRE-family HTH domain
VRATGAPSYGEVVTIADHDRGLFPALLKHWRRQRGLSQLDLAVAADVSARHISFLETGRSTPSPEMVLQLTSTLGVPLHQVNTMLRAAGHEAVYDEDDQTVPPLVAQAIDALKRHHEPFPLVVLNRTYDLVDLNEGAMLLFHRLFEGIDVGPLDALNLARVCFDPDRAHPLIVNFDEVGRQLLWRIQREVLAQPDDGQLRGLLDDLLASPTVSEDWRRADLTVPSDPALVLHLRRGDIDLRFLTLVTAFQAPQNVVAEHLTIETWFPSDAATTAYLTDGS